MRATKAELKGLGLSPVRTEDSGITRRRAGKGFCYYTPDGQKVANDETIERIRSLVIPPAWTDVWICLNPNGYIQATGRDQKGRKQILYHPCYRQHREQQKYQSIAKLRRSIKKVRMVCQAHLRQSGLPKIKVLAMLVRLLDKTLIRIGNDKYAEENGSYGLTTLRNRHVQIEGGKITFMFRGKSGKDHVVEVADRTLAKHLQTLKKMPGKRLFQYMHEGEGPVPVSSRDVNNYLKEHGGQDLSAKAYRTVGATTMAAALIKERKPKTKKAVKEIIAEVADTLGNTVTVCQKSYIDPSVLEVIETAS